MKRKHKDRTEKLDAQPSTETIADLTISLETDIPFGKQLYMGLYEYTIYERATEEGYYAGIVAHLKFIHDHGDDPPAMLDDEGFALMLNAFMPKGLPAHDQSMWRAHFITGWSAVFLGLIREVPDDEIIGG
jgi:hypothetical protein